MDVHRRRLRCGRGLAADEGQMASAAEVMDGSRAQLFARSCLARNKNAGIAFRYRRDFFDLLQEFLVLANQFIQTPLSCARSQGRILQIIVFF